MEEKFILVRNRAAYSQSGKYPRVHVSAETYRQIADWAIITGKPLSELVGMAVKFAADHAAIVEE